MEHPVTNHLQAMRRLRGETQESLAARLNVQPTAISRWERGERVPSLYWALRLADVLACRVDDLFVLPEDSQ